MARNRAPWRYGFSDGNHCMASYDDNEQDEHVKEWLRKNAIPIIVGIVIGLALIFGYRQWKKHQAGENVAAANQYQLIQNAVSAGHKDEANTLTDSLLKNHADSAYAVFAATLRARRELGAGKPGKAVKSLTWAAQHADSGPLKTLTHVRLARAELDAGKANAALAALKAVPTGAYQGLVAELRGDAQVQLGHAAEATRAYQSALAAFDPASPQRRVVK